MSILDKSQKFLSRFRGASVRPPLEKYYVAMLCALLSYSTADLIILYNRPKMLPTQAPPVKPQKPNRSRMRSLADYNAITDRDIFNQDGKIPPALSSGKDDNQERPAVPSQLPIQLLGTIVSSNPNKSIATVNLTSKSLTNSYKVGEDIEGLCKVVKIERKKLTFLNTSLRRMEYIEIPEDSSLNFGVQATAAAPGNVEQTGKFQFSLQRKMVEGLTSNLSSLLQQARMEPVFSADGISVDGFRFVGIQPDSVYEKLGFKVGDMIKSVNGEPVNSPTKAMEMYNLLKTTSSVQLGVERDGREERFNYNIQ